MRTCQIVLRERCAPVTVFARRRRFPLAPTATRESGIPRLARAVRLMGACGLLVVLTAPPARAADIGTAFTYQGFLEKPAGVPVTSTCDFKFSLWDALAGPSQIGATQTVTGVTVSRGVFTVGSPDIDFGPGAFDGEARWLAIDVQCIGDTVFVSLIPRVELTPAPYAQRASNGVGPPDTLEIDQATGNVGIGTTSPSPTQKLDVVGNIHASGGISSGNTINVCGAGPSGLQYISSDGLMDLYVDDPNPPSSCPPNAPGAHRALRLEPGGTPDNVNVIGGHVSNSVPPGVDGAVIAGGGSAIDPNQVTDDYGTVSGGASNRASGFYSVVGGGFRNTANATATLSTVGGGQENTASGGGDTVGGGARNTASGFYSVVGGGDTNTASGQYSTVSGGNTNTASGNASTVGGGAGNKAGGTFSFAAGRQAIVRDNIAAPPGGDEGTFVWADSTNLSFTSTGPDQFLIRATGGVGIGTTSPEHQLQVNGNTSVYGNDSTLLFGQENVLLPGTWGEWGIEYWQAGLPEPGPTGGLNFWKPSGSTGGFGNNFLFLSDNGNVGVGTPDPQSKLQVVDDYIQIPTTPGRPLAGDCDPTKAGRMVVVTADPNGAVLCVCLGSGGWKCMCECPPLFCGKFRYEFDNVVDESGNAGPGPVTIDGTSRRDLIIGSDFQDVISGKGNDDCIYGGDGPDDIHGDDNFLTLDTGNDMIFGEGGHDTIHGDANHDTIYGGYDPASLRGGPLDAGDDIFGDAGNDTIHGGEGDDTIEGEAGADDICGGAGADTITGSSGDDTLDGGPDTGDSCDGGDFVGTDNCDGGGCETTPGCENVGSYPVCVP